ncbi:probable sodium/potassium/calcium exchanger CG1090 [Culex quinquefasciatus]|uniref:probable sodium/potassium/calcium exchanger CG1090 n=1 Tax=Culex quinquefasciatus TaxID=7176 RepID=UPI0018E357C3|nr:probable sodium/potassium/calcium exchanger CG1090 [Culex quinquefasciatus]XP_038113329.1 probable sodium/potassium/calcium exchanger CG1090 [Culex quinquefasciatus]
MKRTRRGRYWHMGIVFLIYSSFHAYSATIGGNGGDDLGDDSGDLASDLPPNVSPNPLLYSTTGTTDGSEEEGSSTPETATAKIHHGHPTWRPRRENCTPPAIEQFPRPLMGPYIRRHGGLVLHVLVAMFTFLGLAIVCDDYFVSSLDRICEELKLSPDVAGATFMAAGSSAPELATVVIGVFFAKDDIGISGVIGSAVFNIMFVISVCALCSGTVSQLNWWPLVRDCTFYSISILVMLIVIFNDVISWIESLVMLMFYVLYCVALHFNSPLEKWAHTWNLPIKLPTKEEQSALVTYKNLPDTTYTQGQQPGAEQQQPPQPVEQPPVDQGYANYADPNSGWDPNAAWGEQQAAPAVNNSYAQPSYNPNDAWGTEGQQNYGYEDQYGQDAAKSQQVAQAPQQQLQTAAVTTGAVQPAGGDDYYKPKEPRPQDSKNPLEKPVDGGIFAQISWAVVYPIHYTARLTMPDCKTEKYKNWYPFTFVVSMIWISFYSYFMVWMITIIGSTLGIPDTVMGLTFVAAGVSVPDALSSIAVIKEGYGDMAVSNAVGSNVFDILICLGLPWFIQTAIIKPGSHVNVISKGLTYSTLSLLSTVFFLLFATHMNGWKLDKRLGIILMVWYLLFITVASLYELNFFGQLNPPECPSIY